jgi:xylulokinase
MSLMGIDVGTSGTKAVAFSHEGTPLASAGREYPLSSPQPGWMEIDPYEVAAAIRGVIGEVAAATKHDPVTALSVSAMGETAIPVSADGRYLYNGQVSMDERTAAYPEWWHERMDPLEVYRITGHSIYSIYTVPRTQWIMEHMPEVYRNTWKFLCFPEFVFHLLGAEPVTDYSEAARTMGFDVRRMEWSPRIFEVAGLDIDKFPRAVQAGTIIGTVSDTVADELGLPRGVQCVTGGHDQPCNALGAGVITGGSAVYGTGSVDCITPAFDGFVESAGLMENNLACYPHTVPGKYCSVAYNSTGGNLLKWYRDEMGDDERRIANEKGVDPYEVILADLPDGPAPVMVLPHFTVTGTPWFDVNSRGAILGLKLTTTRKEIVKGLIEGTTFEMKLNLEVLRAAGWPVEFIRSTGGGAKSALWNQLKADMLGVPVATLQTSEGGSLGTAILAGTATGVYSSIDEAVSVLIKDREIIDPRPEMVERYDERFALYREVYPTLKELNHRL